MLEPALAHQLKGSAPDKRSAAQRRQRAAPVPEPPAANTGGVRREMQFKTTGGTIIIAAPMLGSRLAVILVYTKSNPKWHLFSDISKAL